MTTDPAAPLQAALDDFRAWCGMHGPQTSPQTAKRYAADVRDFWVQYGPLATVSSAVCRTWYEAEVAAHGPSTVNRKMSALKAGFAWVRAMDLRTDDPLAGLGMRARPTRLPRPVPHEDMLRLLDVIRQDSGWDLWACQDLAIAELLYGSGLRREEAACLTLGMIQGRDSVRVIGKGDTERVTILTDQAYSALATWVRRYWTRQGSPLVESIPAEVRELGSEAVFQFVQQRHPTLPCFYTVQHRPMADRADPGSGIYYRLKPYAAQIGLQITPHQFRHSFGTELLNGGADLLAVSRVMGHTDVRTTKGYAALQTRGLRAIRAAHTRQRDPNPTSFTPLVATV